MDAVLFLACVVAMLAATRYAYRWLTRRAARGRRT